MLLFAFFCVSHTVAGYRYKGHAAALICFGFKSHLLDQPIASRRNESSATNPVHKSVRIDSEDIFKMSCVLCLLCQAARWHVFGLHCFHEAHVATQHGCPLRLGRQLLELGTVSFLAIQASHGGVEPVLHGVVRSGKAQRANVSRVAQTVSTFFSGTTENAESRTVHPNAWQSQPIDCPALHASGK